ncbi:MAG: hypothetical protein HY321_10305 [Armatimonadetes bacterium]|nr:hypothetical protein [Armatimonadota bacterium]
MAREAVFMLLQNPLNTRAFRPEETAVGAVEHSAARAGWVTRITDYVPAARSGDDWRNEGSSEGNKEFSWYSDDPEDLTNEHAGTRFLMYSMHGFTAPVMRWMRLYLYHQAVGATRHIRVGVFNRDGSKPIRAGGAIIRPVSGTEIIAGSEAGRLTMARMAALSLHRAGDIGNATHGDVESHHFESPVMSTAGWHTIETVTAPAGRMLHRIYELYIEPAPAGPSSLYYVCAYTVPSATGDNLEIPAIGGTWDPGRPQLIWPSDGRWRYGLYRYSLLRQSLDTISWPPAQPPSVFVAQISHRRHSLGEPPAAGDAAVLGEVLGSPARENSIYGGHTAAPLRGNYPAWTEMTLTFDNTSRRVRLVQVWVDGLFWQGLQPYYWGAVTLRQHSTGCHNYGLQAGDTAVIPPIRANAPGSEEHESSALIDCFTAWEQHTVTRTYRFMHGGGAILPVALFVDARAPGRPWREVGFPTS